MRNHLLLCAFLLICGGLNAQTQLLGSPTTLVKNRGAFMSDSLLYIPKRSKTPADSGAIRYQISDSAIYVWTGSQWIKAGAGGTVTSITAGTGLSGGTITSSGTIAVDTFSIATRLRVQKGIDSLGAAKQNVLTNPVTGTGTTNYLAKFTGTSAVGNSQIFDDGGSIGIGTATPTYKFDIRGTGSMVHSIKSNSGSGQGATYQILQSGGSNALLLIGDKSGQVGGTPDQSAALRAGTNIPIIFEPNAAEAMRLNTAGEMIVSSDGTDAGAYKLQVQGNIYNTTGAVFAATSGSVGIGTTLTTGKLNFENTTAVVTDGIIFTAANVAGTNHGFRIGINRQARAEVASSIKFLAENYSSNDATYITFGTGASDAERMRITSDGKILAGTTSAFSGGLNEQRIQSYGTDDLAGFSALRVSANTGGSRFVLAKSRGATYTIVNNNDGLGIISFQGADGSTLYRSAEISGQVDGTPSAGSVPGRLVFETNMSERMRIKSDGEVLIATTSDAGAYALQVSGNQYVSSSFYMNPANSSDNYMLLGTSTVRETSGIVRGVLQVVGRSLNTGGITIAGELTNNAFGNYLQFIKSRSTSNTIVQNGDHLGGVILSGADGTNYLRGAIIGAYVDGTPGTNDMPTRLEFATTKDGTSVPTIWMILNNNGELLLDENPVDAGAYKLQVDGAIYSTSTITTGAPSGGTAKPFKIGAAATVSPTSPNRTIEIEIDGTTYYIHAKTTNN